MWAKGALEVTLDDGQVLCVLLPCTLPGATCLHAHIP